MKDRYHDKNGKAINLPKVGEIYTKSCAWCKKPTKTSSNLGKPVCNKCMTNAFRGIF
jgi:hypothetical protein